MTDNQEIRMEFEYVVVKQEEPTVEASSDTPEPEQIPRSPSTTKEENFRVITGKWVDGSLEEANDVTTDPLREQDYPWKQIVLREERDLKILTANHHKQQDGKKKIKFRVSDDIALLKQVKAENPLLHEDRWEEILRILLRHIKKPFTLRNIKDRVNYLIKDFNKEERVILRKSGTEEEYQEKEILLAEVSQLYKEYKKPGRQQNTHKERAGEGEAVKVAPAAVAHAQASRAEGQEEEEDEGGGGGGEKSEDFVNISDEVEREQMQGPGDQTVEMSVLFNVLGSQVLGLSRSPTHQLSSPSIPNVIEAGLKQPQPCKPLGSLPIPPERFPKKRKEDDGLIGSISERNQEEIQLKKRALDLEERKLQLEERRLALEERKLDLEERETMRKLDLEETKFTQLVRSLEKRDNALLSLLNKVLEKME